MRTCKRGVLLALSRTADKQPLSASETHVLLAGKAQCLLNICMERSSSTLVPYSVFCKHFFSLQKEELILRYYAVHIALHLANATCSAQAGSGPISRSIPLRCSVCCAAR